MNRSLKSGPIVVKTVCKAAVVNDKGQLLLLRRSETHPTHPLTWDLVGGYWEGGNENFEQALRREAEEEAGIKLKQYQLYKVMPEMQADGNYKLYVSFLARIDHSRVILGKEHDLYTWAGLSDLSVYELPLVWYATAVAALKLAGDLNDRAML